MQNAMAICELRFYQASLLYYRFITVFYVILRDSSLTLGSKNTPSDSSTEKNEAYSSRKALKKKLKNVVLSVIKEDSDASIGEKVSMAGYM